MLFWQITIDASDPPRLAHFWAHALGYQSAPPTEPVTTWSTHYRDRLGERAAFADRIFDPEALRPPIWFQKVPEAKAGKNRIHLDLYPTDRDDALPQGRRVGLVETMVDDLVAIGASVVRRPLADDPDYFVVMHDPEGNEFCVS